MKRTISLPLLLILASCGEGTSENRVESIPGAVKADVNYSSPGAETIGQGLLDHVRFSSGVTAETKAFIQYDLKNLANWTDATRPEALAKFGAIAGLAEVNASTMSQWFMDRITYIYPDGSFRFTAIVPEDRALYEVNIPQDPSALVGGSNVGAEIFGFYQMNHPDNGVDGLMLNFDDKLIPFLSPRTGAMQIGPALFDDDDSLDATGDASYRMVKSIYRLSILFHEARHSDGSHAKGNSGFGHSLCPNDGSVAQEYVGQYACDSQSNGAYALGAEALGALTGLCDGVCSNSDLMGLQSIRLDLLSRLMVANTAANYGDPTPEAPLPAIDTTGYKVVPE